MLIIRVRRESKQTLKINTTWVRKKIPFQPVFWQIIPSQVSLYNDPQLALSLTVFYTQVIFINTMYYNL